MYACVHACMRACIHACVHACIHTCVRAYIHACVHTLGLDDGVGRIFLVSKFLHTQTFEALAEKDFWGNDPYMDISVHMVTGFINVVFSTESFHIRIVKCTVDGVSCFCTNNIYLMEKNARISFLMEIEDDLVILRRKQ